MPFPKEIFAQAEARRHSTPPVPERRGRRRFKVNRDFALHAGLGFIGRDASGAPMGESRHNWNWKGRLLDCSEQGARIQLGAGVRAAADESCDLKLSLGNFALSIPCHVTNLHEAPEGVVLGLRFDAVDADTQRDYRQLLEVIGLADSLRLQARATEPDQSGYLVEVYANRRSARLTVWRLPDDGSAAAFEFVLGRLVVRAADGLPVEFLCDPDGAGSRPASGVESFEIGRLFTWVVPNLPAAVPADVRAFLQRYAV